MMREINMIKSAGAVGVAGALLATTAIADICVSYVETASGVVFRMSGQAEGSFPSDYEVERSSCGQPHYAGRQSSQTYLRTEMWGGSNGFRSISSDLATGNPGLEDILAPDTNVGKFDRTVCDTFYGFTVSHYIPFSCEYNSRYRVSLYFGYGYAGELIDKSFLMAGETFESLGLRPGYIKIPFAHETISVHVGSDYSLPDDFEVINDLPSTLDLNEDGDDDGDGVQNGCDNCPNVPNPSQTDADGNGVGDACEGAGDSDGDDIPDDVDNCPNEANANQTDSDGDGVGDACDLCDGDDAAGDTDGDGYCDDTDNCPNEANPDQADADDDLIGDVCEADSDADGTIDDYDNCLEDPNPLQEDNDGDGAGDVCDADDDNDSVDDAADNCPLIANVGQADFDGDGQGDACDGDDDGDGVADDLDFCPGTAVGETRLDENGCSGAQYVALHCGSPCDYANHGQYVKCVVHAANAARDLGLLTNKERAAIVRAAAKNKCH